MIFEPKTESRIKRVLTWIVCILLVVLWALHFTRGTEMLESTEKQVIELPPGWTLYGLKVDIDKNYGLNGRAGKDQDISLNMVSRSTYVAANPSGTAYLINSDKYENLVFVFVGNNGKIVNESLLVRTPCSAFQKRKVQDEGLERWTNHCVYNFLTQETSMQQSVYTKSGFGFKETFLYTALAFLLLWVVKRYVIR